MRCTCPIPAWPAAPPLRGVVFTPRKSYAGAVGYDLPCGRCVGCRLSRASQWATRITHEAALHSSNSFLTLTYDNESLPVDLSVSVSVLQLFLKRFRKSIEPARIRFVACGEYGTINSRPHYHLIIFGHGFERDRYSWRKAPSGHTLYRSPALEKLWPYGACEIGSVTPQSGGYVARYTLKKVFGAEAAQAPQYARQRVDPLTGEVFSWFVSPEFFVSSRRPGIGDGWRKRHHADAFPSGFVVHEGAKRSVPAFYVRKFQAEEPEAAERFMIERRKKAAELAALSSGGPTPLERHEFNLLTKERFERDTEKS